MLSEDQKRLLIGMIERGEPLPAEYRRLLFANDGVELVERTGVYSLEYKGKAREQDILADTPSAPLQEIGDFNADNPDPEHPDWRNLLIYLLVTRYQPERKFAAALFAHAELFDAFVKNADMGFFKLPYSFKSAIHAKTHSKTETFNLDFILKLAGRDVLLVVEIKNDDDDSARNRAKLRDAREHFKLLNKELEQSGERWRYMFYFLSPADYAIFFQAVRENRLEYVSSSMNELSRSAGD